MYDTKIIKIDSDGDLDKLEEAARCLRTGGLVAFPTETVYGLGANALDEAAAAGIYSAKGRPSDNPLIVHVTSIEDVAELVECIPPKARTLMERFWPGPLTLIMKKSPAVPKNVTGGLDTIAVRMPSHPAALRLISEARVPVAAPSANISGKPSPTSAGHVIEDLMGRVQYIIDAGSVEVGLESTVLDMTSDPPVILRPGAVTVEQLEEAVGPVTTDPAILKKDTSDLVPKAPGMKYKHYSPNAEVIIVDGPVEKTVDEINRLAGEYISKGKKVLILATKQTQHFYPQKDIIIMGDRKRPATIAAGLFACLRESDLRSAEVVLAEAVDRAGIGSAIMNRMSKAAGYNIIKV